MSRSSRLRPMRVSLQKARTAIKRQARRVTRPLAAIRVIARFAGELATATSLIGGWVLVTYGITAVVRPRLAWPISIGLLLISAGGWRMLADIARDGLYIILKSED